MSTNNNEENTLRFTKLEVKGVKEIDAAHCEVVEDDADADFFSIYGRDEDNFAHCIGDFSTRHGAETIKAAIESGR